MIGSEKPNRQWSVAAKIAYRFFTGLHLDGKRRQRSRKGGKGSVLPIYRDYYWNRYSRGQRAVWRNGILWITVLTGYGMIVDRPATIYAIFAVSPFLGLVVCRKLVKIFTMKTQTYDSDGAPDAYRHLRPKYARMIRSAKARRFKLYGPPDGPVPADYERPILAANSEDGGTPITNLRRPLNELLTNEAAPRDGRSRTIRRSIMKRSER